MQTVSWDDSAYPVLLRSYQKAPAVLCCAGDISLLNRPSVAIVGTREPTPLGRKIAFALAAFFASQGYVIVSGLALGCDTEAHRGALSVGGATLAVLGTSFASVYPRENIPLSREIVRCGGLLVTEYTDDVFAPARFVARDYLQAALSLAVIPVQAGEKSGTFHACRAAVSLHRWLFLPVPVSQDEQAYPSCYAGIRILMKQKAAIAFAGKQDYPVLLDYLQSSLSV